MLTLHHLNDSRSQRIFWLLEELGTPYEIKHYQRNAETRLAPPELTAVHPLGKSPVITDGGLTIAESGAIVDYLIRTYGKGALMPAPGSADYEAYNEWLHYSEGSAILPLMLKYYVSRLGDAGAPLSPRIESEIANHQGYINQSLGWIGLGPYDMLYNNFAVIFGLVYVYMPFMVLPLYATIERLDKSFLEASLDLGASQFTTFLKVTVPLTMPGIITVNPTK